MNKHRPSTINYERHFSIYVSASEPGLVPRTLWYEQQDMTEERRARSTRGEKTVNEAELEDELSIKKEGGEERREIDEVKWVRVERKDDKQAI